MITGATLIDYREKYDTKTFFKKRISKTLIPFITWSIIGILYNLIKNPLYLNGKSIAMIISDIINCNIISIYWFFIPLFSIYLSIPLLSLIPKDKRKTIFNYAIIISFFTISLLPTLFKLFGIQYNYEFTISVTSGYLIYILLGYNLSHYDLMVNTRRVIYGLSLAGLIIHIYGTYYLSFVYGQIIDIFKGYTNFPCVLYSIGIFVLFRYMEIPEKISHFIKKILFMERYTFSIYLAHYFIIDIIVSLFNINVLSIVYRLISPLVIIAISIGVVKIIRKIPFAEKIVP